MDNIPQRVKWSDPDEKCYQNKSLLLNSAWASVAQPVGGPSIKLWKPGQTLT
jgi:hypothetical protein